MYCIIDFCCICFCNKELVKHLSDSDSENITYYVKLIFCVPEMCFNVINEQGLVCNKCCETMDAAYKFRQRCLRSKTALTDYVSQLHQVSNLSGTVNVYLSDINKFCAEKQCQKEFTKKPETSTNQDINERVTDNYINFENVVVKMEQEDQYFEEYVEGSYDNQDEIKISNQNDMNLTAAIKKENANNDERLQPRFDILESCDSKNDKETKVGDNYLYYKKFSDGSLTNPDEIKFQIADNDIKSVNSELNIQFKSEDIVEFSADNVIPLKDQDEDTTDQGTNSSHKPLKRQQKTTPSIDTSTFKIPKAKPAPECTICQKKFTLPSSLRNHMKIHTNERPHACSVCPKKFFEPSKLLVHLRTHSGEKPHACPVCEKRFSENTTLRQHMRVHTLEKPYECDVCQKRFSKLSNMKTHIRSHTGEKPYGCGECGKRFSQSSNLSSHMRIHRGERPHECGVCRKKFTESSTLRNHMNSHLRKITL